MESIQIHDKTFVPYLKDEEIQEIVKATALKIYEDYKDETPVFIGVLNGVILFFSDLLKHYPGKCEIAFLQMSSYAGTQSTGIVYQKMEITKDIKDRHIILVEDIVDTGNTLVELHRILQEKKVKSLKVATLLFKPEAYKKDLKVDLVGISIPDKFVVGYGLDFDGLGRNLPDIYQIKH